MHLKVGGEKNEASNPQAILMAKVSNYTCFYNHFSILDFTFISKVIV